MVLSRHAMLSKIQAERISDDLLEQHRRERIQEKNAVARRVPLVHSVSGLSELEPWERIDLASQAIRAINNRWYPTLIALAAVAICCSAWWLAGLFSKSTAVSVLLYLLCGAVVYAMRAYFVRQEIRRRLSARKNLSP